MHPTYFRRICSGAAAATGLVAAIMMPAAAAEPAAPSAGPHPVMEIREPIKDGGEVEEGTVVKYRFTVANRGQADLEIKNVKPSCGCTVSEWDRVIQPGKEGTIGAEMRTEYFRGQVMKHLTVSSNDPERPAVELTITAHINPLVQISPYPAALLSVHDKPVTREFTLERNGHHPMKVLEVIANAPYLKAAVTPLSGEGRYKVSVTATTDTPLGRSTVPVVVRTDMEKGAMLTLVLTLDRGIVTAPPLVFFGLLPKELKQPALAMVTVTREAEPFHVTGVTVDDPKLQPKLETVREGAEYRITVTYAGGWDLGVANKTLTVTTDDAKQPILKIPVQAVVQEKAVDAPAGNVF